MGRQDCSQGAMDSIIKLNPKTMMRNPVMFVVEVGSVLTTMLLVKDFMHGVHGLGFSLQIALWLWFTVVFANFAEAMAEGRGKAQAETLRRAKSETIANRLLHGGRIETSFRLRAAIRRSGGLLGRRGDSWGRRNY